MSPKSKAPTQQEIEQAQREMKKLAEDAGKALFKSKGYKVLQRAGVLDKQEQPAPPPAKEPKSRFKSTEEFREACDRKALEILNFLEGVLPSEYYQLISYAVDMAFASHDSGLALEWEYHKATKLLQAAIAKKPSRAK